jgi:DNA polymerase III subunit gamma/tau
MSSQVFYRKWRPQTLAEVVGQETVTRTLLSALEKERIAHAYLFCGPRGTGKTSTGRILAKAVNCLKNGHGEPCNECTMCQAVTEGHAMDIIEIDAASNTGIDDIRDLREKVNYHPGEARFKVYIIDEVHMLSNAASNALLKTLEEPPPRVIFVLATTETHKPLPTIISRCQRFDFHRLTQEDVVDKLAKICGEEGIDIPPEGLNLIARRTRGSLRDAENLLQQVSTYYGNTAGLSQIQEMLGITGDARVRELAGHIMTSDIAAGMAVINAVNQDGLDLKQFNRELIDYLRAVMLTVSGAGASLDLTDDERHEVDTLAKKATLPRLLHAVKLFGQLDFSFDQYSSLPLEMALVDSILSIDGNRTATADAPAASPAASPATPPPEAAKPKTKPQPRAEIPKPAAKETVAPQETPPAVEETTSPPVKTEVKAATEAASDDAVEISEPPPAAKPEEPEKETELPATSADSGDELARLGANWKHLIDTAPPEVRKSAAIGYIRSAGVRPIAIEDDAVVLTFRYEIHKKQVEKPENQRIVAGIISGFLNRPCRIRCVCQPENNHLVRAVQNLGAEITSVEEK